MKFFKRKLKMIPEGKPVKQPSIWQRSWTIRLLKRDDAAIWLTLIGLFLAIGILELHITLVDAFFKEKVVMVGSFNYVRVARAAETTDVESMTIPEYVEYKFGKNAGTVMKIMNAESGGNPYAINKNNDKGGTLDLGCMQLNEKWQLKPRGLTRADAFDCKKSLDVSYQIYQEQGHFCAWVTYQKMYKSKCN